MRILNILGALAFSALIFAPETFAQRGQGAWVERLELSSEQRSQVAELRSENMALMQQLRGELNQAQSAFGQALKDPGVDESALRILHAKLLEAKQKMTEARFEQMLKIRALLGAEQITFIPEPGANRRAKGSGVRARRLQQ